jgi:CheY-like chemotaxis protein
VKILVVDDSQMVRLIVKRWFEQLKVPEADVIEASNGEIALKAFEKYPIDAVITDWSMPDPLPISVPELMRESVRV